MKKQIDFQVIFSLSRVFDETDTRSNIGATIHREICNEDPVVFKDLLQDGSFSIAISDVRDADEEDQ